MEVPITPPRDGCSGSVTRKRHSSRRIASLIDDLLVGVEEKYCPALKTELSKVSELCSMNTKDLLLEATYALNKILVNKTEISHVWGHMYSNIEDQRTTPYTSADEESENNVKLQALRDNKLAPSSCTWNILQEGNIIYSFQDFSEDMQGMKRVLGGSAEPTMDSTASSMVHIIEESTLPLNRGYPQLICENIIAQVVSNLNHVAGRKQYRFLSSPTVKSEMDKRKNKHSDIGLHRLKLYNQRTYILIECKCGVPIVLMGDDTTVNHLSQLFLEAVYMHNEENAKLEPSEKYKSIMCGLTDGAAWHIFVIDLTTRPITFLEYITINEPANSEAAKRAVQLFCDYVPAKLS